MENNLDILFQITISKYIWPCNIMHILETYSNKYTKSKNIKICVLIASYRFNLFIE